MHILHLIQKTAAHRETLLWMPLASAAHRGSLKITIDTSRILCVDASSWNDVQEWLPIPQRQLTSSPLVLITVSYLPAYGLHELELVTTDHKASVRPET